MSARGVVAAALLALLVPAVRAGQGNAAERPTQPAPDAKDDGSANVGNDTPAVAAHAQATYIWQYKPAFNAAYTGPQSLLPTQERSYSFTTTVDLGFAPWRGAQLHVNPEGALGVPLSDLQGVGGVSNGELQRGASQELRTYRARLFFQQRIGMGGGTETVDPDMNEMGGTFDKRRWTFTVGTLSLLDFMDPSPYAKDPREQFMNWSFLTHGAWDYPGDARGYTNAAIVEYKGEGWAVRAMRAMQPRESNGQDLDGNLGRQHGDAIEAESDLPVAMPGGPLHGRLLLFRNRIDAGSFEDALALGAATGTTPDVSLVRHPQHKRGIGLTLEAPLAPDEGVFLRASRSDGQLEEYTFAEIDSQIAVGAQFTGGRWGRGNDRVGVALAVNGLSSSHRDYLAAGGVGFFLGDGRLNYGPEDVFETYYRWALPDVKAGAVKLASAISVGFQHIVHPGYNRDRGPVQTYTLRWHSDF